MNKVLIIVLVAVGVLLVGILVLTFVGGIGVFLASDGVRGSGTIVTETRDVDGFERVKICCGLKLILRQGETTSVSVTGDDNIVPEIQTNVSGNTLVVKWDTTIDQHHPSQQVVCDITMAVIEGVELSGGAELETAALTADQFTLKTSGGSRAEIDSLVAGTFELDSSGGSNTSINSGQIADQTVHLDGGDSLDAADMESQHADIEVSGGSDATIWVTESLVIKASGGGEVTYYGSPTVEQDVSGGSKVQSKGER
jgi:hypothetical protein